MKRCTFKICRIDWDTYKAETEERAGYETTVLDLRCFVDHRSHRCWVVTEAMTGYCFASGDTRANAIQVAGGRLKQHNAGFFVKVLLKTAHSIGADGLPWPVNKSEEL